MEDVLTTVDTGLAGALMIGKAQVDRLALRFRGETTVGLADGSVHGARRYAAEVAWFGNWRQHTVVCLEGGPLLGMGLLHGRQLEIVAVEGGRVAVSAIPASAGQPPL